MKRKQKLLMSCPYCKAALTLNIRETHPGVSINAELPYNPGWRIGNKKVERPNGDVQLFKILFRNRRCKVR